MITSTEPEWWKSIGEPYNQQNKEISESSGLYLRDDISHDGEYATVLSSNCCYS